MGRVTTCDQCGKVIENEESYYQLSVHKMKREGVRVIGAGSPVVADMCRRCGDKAIRDIRKRVEASKGHSR